MVAGMRAETNWATGVPSRGPLMAVGNRYTQSSLEGALERQVVLSA
jgi:hypothetical protein